MINSEAGTLYGIGVGPGDPELLTLKAHRLIQQSPYIAYLCSREDHSMAREIVRHCIDSNKRKKQQEIAIAMPMHKDRTQANQIYDQTAAEISDILDQGYDVAFLCEGDPFFFGSFAYLFERLQGKHYVDVIPGISSVQSSAAAIGRPLTLLTEKMAVLSGRHSDQHILQTLGTFESVVIMKPGSQRARLLGLIEQSGRTQDGVYIEYAGHPEEKIVRDLRQITGSAGPYFSMILLQGMRDTRQSSQE